jgi:hypothetical protein
LLSAIKGDAMRVIQHVQINEEGFQIAWELLLERYENEGLIINTHIDNIKKQPAMLSENTAQLRQLVGATKSNLKAFYGMKQNTDSWAAMIIDILAQRLDNKAKMEWELQISDKQAPTLQQLYTFFEHRCNALHGLKETPKIHELRHETAKRTAPKGHTQSHVSVKEQCILCKDTYLIQHFPKLNS